MEHLNERKFWLEFIKMYRDREVLWKAECDSYKDIVKRKKALDELVIKLKQLDPDADVNLVRKKIVNIRSGYRRELRKMRMRRETGDSGYESSWWLFKYLSFLRTIEEQDPLSLCDDTNDFSGPPSKRMKNVGEISHHSSRVSLTSQQQTKEYSAAHFKNGNSEKIGISTSQPIKKDDQPSHHASRASMSSHHHHHTSHARREHSTMQNKHSISYESALLAKSWALQYRALPSEQRLYVKRGIDAIFFEASLGTLHKDSIKVNHATCKDVIKGNHAASKTSETTLKPKPAEEMKKNTTNQCEDATPVVPLVIVPNLSPRQEETSVQKQAIVRSFSDEFTEAALSSKPHTNSTPRLKVKSLQKMSTATDTMKNATKIVPSHSKSSSPKKKHVHSLTDQKTVDETSDIQKNTHRAKRKMWAKDLYLKRMELSYENTFEELMMESPEVFKTMHGMDIESFEELLRGVTPYIQKQDTIMRKSISPRQRLSASLRYLTSGQTLSDLKEQTAIAPSTLGKLLLQTCSAIAKVLENIKLPTTKDEWKNEATDFKNFWNFPNCLGALIGKHIQIKKPPRTKHEYVNYNKTTSVLLMALVNANYQFLMIDVGSNSNGQISDDDILMNTDFYHKMAFNMGLDLPDPEALPYNSQKLPYVFLGDHSMPLLENLMIPYEDTFGLTEEQKIYNCNVTKAHSVAENAISIMSNRFKVLKTAIYLAPEKAAQVILTCCYLHNFLLERNSEDYLNTAIDSENTNKEAADTTGETPELFPLLPMQNRFGAETDSTDEAKEIRSDFCAYFNAVEANPWQELYW